VTYNSATAYCEALTDGGGTIISRGVAYSKLTNPVISDSVYYHASGGLGTYSINISNLRSNETYYVRAFVENESGIAYSSEELSFTTCIPEVETLDDPITNNPTSLTLYGNAITSCGIPIYHLEMDISYNADMSDKVSVVSGSTSLGQYSVTLSGRVGYTQLYITPNTTYYYRASLIPTVPINGSYFIHGDILSVTTPACSAPSFISMGYSSSNTTSSSFKVSPNITSDGGCAVTERGAVASTTPNPTTSNIKVSSGNGTGQYDVTFTGLSSNTTYYVRPYAINSLGTTYGTELEITITTLP